MATDFAPPLKATGDVQALPLGSQLVTALQGRPIASTAPSPGHALEWIGSAKQWVPTYPPGREIGYDEITSTVNITGTTSAAPTTVISGSSYSFDGTGVIAEFFAPFVQTPSNAAGGFIEIGIYESGSLLAILAELITPAAANLRSPVMAKYRFTPSSGSHTYSIAAWVGSTTGTPFVSGSSPPAQVPAFLRFTKL